MPSPAGTPTPAGRDDNARGGPSWGVPTLDEPRDPENATPGTDDWPLPLSTYPPDPPSPPAALSPSPEAGAIAAGCPGRPLPPRLDPVPVPQVPEASPPPATLPAPPEARPRAPELPPPPPGTPLCPGMLEGCPGQPATLLRMAPPVRFGVPFGELLLPGTRLPPGPMYRTPAGAEPSAAPPPDPPVATPPPFTIIPCTQGPAPPPSRVLIPWEPPETARGSGRGAIPTRRLLAVAGIGADGAETFLDATIHG